MSLPEVRCVDCGKPLEHIQYVRPMRFGVDDPGRLYGGRDPLCKPCWNAAQGILPDSTGDQQEEAS